MKIKIHPIFRIFYVFFFILIIVLLSYRSTKILFMTMYGDIDPEIFSFRIIVQLFTGFYALLFSTILTKGKLFKHGYKFVKNNYLIKVLSIVFISELVISFIFSFFPITGKEQFDNQWSFLQIVFGVWIIASTTEELLCRGLIQSYLAPLQKYKLRIKSINLSLPIIISAIFFMLMHSTLILDGMDKVLYAKLLISALSLGLIAGYFREKSGSVIPAIIAHSFANVCCYFFELFI